MKNITRTDIGILVLRLGIGLSMVFFGSQKMFGVFGGSGYADTISMLHDKMGVPIPFAHLAILGEFMGGLGIIVGLLTPVACIGVACTMGVATFMNMKSPGALGGIFSGAHGADPSKLFFPGSLCLSAVAVLLLGPGKIALDRKLFARKSKR